MSKLPSLSQKTKDAVNTFIKTLPENHFLIRLGKVSVLREKLQEGAITAQYVYGGMKTKEELVIPKYIKLVSKENAKLLRFWINHEAGGW